MSKMRNIFLTGITGALGKELLKTLLRDDNTQLFLLIRGKRLQSHWDRARKILSAHGLENYLGTRVQVIKGDITKPKFGMNDDDYGILLRNVNEFFHIAALTTLNGSKKDCYGINLKGTQNALEIANDLKENGKLERFFYFSTAYAAGSLWKFHSPESSLPETPVFANFYEESKYKSETCVREAMKNGLPTTIFRPSIVVGHSKTGVVSEFNVIYPFMKMFAHGILSKLPSRLDCAFNIVPVDYVVEAAAAISKQQDSVGQCFHLTTKEPPNIGMLLKLKEEEFPSLPHVDVIDPDKFSLEDLKFQEKFVYDILRPYLGYLNGELTFDMTNTEKALSETDVSLPKTNYDFLKVLVQYAVDAGYILV